MSLYGKCVDDLAAFKIIILRSVLMSDPYKPLFLGYDK